MKASGVRSCCKKEAAHTIYSPLRERSSGAFGRASKSVRSGNRLAEAQKTIR